MSIRVRLKKLESKLILAQQKAICLVGCGSGCMVGDSEEFCQHEQQRFDSWVADHDGMEPDLTIRIVGVSPKSKVKAW